MRVRSEAVKIGHARRMRRWRAADPERARRLSAKWRRNHPLQYKAQKAVHNAIRDGRLIRPGACSSCGVKCVPEGHHEDHTKPLEVIWLCRACHLARDGRKVRVD